MDLRNCAALTFSIVTIRLRSIHFSNKQSSNLLIATILLAILIDKTKIRNILVNNLRQSLAIFSASVGRRYIFKYPNICLICISSVDIEYET